MFNDLMNKAKDLASNIDMQKAEEIAKKGKKAVRSQLKEHGVEDYIDRVKSETAIVKQAVVESAQAVYKENEELLEKPVGIVSDVVDKVSKHSDELKWAGGIAVAVVAPVTTAVASAAIFILSDDDIMPEEKKQVIKDLDIIRSETELVEIIVDQKNSKIFGKIRSGKLKDKTFEELGEENMRELLSQLDVEGNEDHKSTSRLINGWLSWKKTNND